jgi:AcrR family transcriptional regulator
MKSDSKRGPGRPRAFDTGAAIDAATQVFWARGYGEASLDDLTAAMGITRPSLYAAFGDKEALMLTCIARYGRWVEGAVSAALADPKRPDAALNAMFADAIALYTMPAPEPRGCLLASASLSDAALSPAIRQAVVEALDGVESVVRSFYDRAGCSPATTAENARLVTTFLYGLAARARLGAAAAELIEDAGRFATRLLPSS